MKSLIVWALLLLVAVSSWGIWKYQNTNKHKVHEMNYLQTKNTNPPKGTNFLPEQRRKFALQLEKKVKDKGMNATFTTTGDFHTTILMQGDEVNGSLVRLTVGNNDMIQDMRDMGFKTLIMTDGSATWSVDLKN